MTSPRPQAGSTGWFARQVLTLSVCLFVFGGCDSERKPKKLTPPEAEKLAARLLAESFAVRGELGDVQTVTLADSPEYGYTFDVQGSQARATLTVMGELVIGTKPEAALLLDDGRRIPLFVDFLEKSYQQDLDLKEPERK